MKILVAGASSRLGRAVIDQLLLAGAEVSVLGLDSARVEHFAVASRGARPVQSVDEDAFATLHDAVERLESIDAVLTVGTDRSSAERKRSANLIAAGARVGLKHLVRLSRSHFAPSGPGEEAGDLDLRMKAAGLAYTHLRPTLLDSTLLDECREIEESCGWYGSAPFGHNAFVDPRDVAAATCAVVLRGPPAMGLIDLTGPEPLTYGEVAQRLSTVLRRDIVYRPVGPETQLKALRQRGLSLGQARARLARDAMTERQPSDTLSDSILQLTGRPAGTLANYLEDHRCAFTSDTLD